MDYYEILRIIENIAGNGRSKVLWKPYGDWLGECRESAERVQRGSGGTARRLAVQRCTESIRKKAGPWSNSFNPIIFF